MEIFTGDRQIPKPNEDFPDHLTPFPESTDLIYAHPEAAIHSPDLISNLPPQKLRPIRCGNGRSPASSEVGLGRFSPDEVMFFNGGSGECFGGHVKVEVGEAVKNGGRDGGLFGAGMGSEWSPSFVERVLEKVVEEEESSSSTDDDDDESAVVKESSNRKRKRKSGRKLELFLESLAMKVMEKQEQMHKQLIEMLEKRESERIIREEAWKQQEMARMIREEEIRSQETSRSLALISFIQNLLGHEIQVPQSISTLCREENGVELDNQNDIKFDPNNKRWPEAEVQALITLRTALEHKFRLTGSKKSMWEEISVGMYNMGYNRTAKKCKEKWENINKYFRRSMESGKKPSANGKTCPYFHELNILSRNGLTNPGSVVNNTNNEIVAKSEKVVNAENTVDCFVHDITDFKEAPES